MSASIEDLVRRAQERQAERAPHPDRIRAALPARAARRARHRRNGTAIAIAAGIAVVTAVTVPVVALREGPDGSLPVGAPPVVASSGPSAAVPEWRLGAAPIRYRPTWLPAGIAERARILVVGADNNARVDRIWRKSPVNSVDDISGARIDVDVRHPMDANDPQANDGTQVDINGKTGYYHGTDGKAYVEWKADPDSVISISEHSLSLSKEDLLRVARSVQPVAETLRVPVRLGHVPPGIVMNLAEVVGNSPTSWNARVSGETPAVAGETTGGKESKESRPSLSVQVGTSTTAPDGGESLTVGGHPARLVKRQIQGTTEMLYLVVTLGQGTIVTVIGDKLTQDDLTAVAERVEVDATPDLSWLGTR